MKKIVQLVIVFVAVLTSSCSNYLDIKPYGRTIPKSAEEFSALLHTHLGRVDEGTDPVLVGNASQWLTWDAECGDDFEVCLTASGGQTLKRYVGDLVGSSAAFNPYRELYQIIRDCNLVLNEMEESGTKQANEVLATAYAMRGVAYYQLMRMYCEAPQAGNLANQLGLPLVTEFDMEAKPKRSTLQQTVDLIEDDLKESLKYRMNEPVYRFTEEVVKGYLARLYFWTQAWDQALPLAQEILNKHPLLAGEAYAKMMSSVYSLGGNQLLKAYRSVSTSGNQGLTGINKTIKTRPVSRRLLANFREGEKDIRYQLWADKKRQVTKVFFCGMRAAEFKLIEAECYYHLKQHDQALQAINELRAHRIADYTYLTAEELPAPLASEIIQVDALGQPLSPLLSLILTERRKELFLEGDRFFEQKRNGTPEFWTAYNGRKYVTQSFMYTLPIPITNINIVDKLVQNPGYTEIKSN